MSLTCNLVRKELTETARTFVVKIGTNVLSNADQALDQDRIAALAGQIHELRQHGKRVVVVSSGSIGAGMKLLGLKSRPKDLPHLQAAAATGQAHLIGLYDQAFRQHGYHAAQLLLTADDFRHRTRYLNVRNTLLTLFEYGCVPIINENDTVSVDEITPTASAEKDRPVEMMHSVRKIPGVPSTKFSDNDQLAAMVTNLLESPLLVILSVIDGLFDGDPHHPDSQLVPLIERWSDDLFEHVGASRSSGGTGGMSSKLQAIKRAVSVGENVILANGHTPEILSRILQGDNVGTAFLARGKTLPAWKRWIGYTVSPRGGYQVDDGARKALVESGKSLLPIGVRGVHGIFDQGEVVSIRTSDGTEFARGLSNYNSEQARLLVGHRSDEIIAHSGELPFLEAVHRDNLVIID
ncbi:MAG: glutamate 5-kinase [Planctomycetaceae bacterium]|nr:glutamate 5-kinase [Planctomycetaceae bacterium]